MADGDFTTDAAGLTAEKAPEPDAPVEKTTALGLPVEDPRPDPVPADEAYVAALKRERAMAPRLYKGDDLEKNLAEIDAELERSGYVSKSDAAPKGRKAPDKRTA